MAKKLTKSELDALYEKACQHEEKGDVKAAVRLLLTGASAGDSGAQLKLGCIYSWGTGVKPNRTRGLYWYRRAFRAGLWAAPANIAMVYLREKKFWLALSWLEKGVLRGDYDALLEIAKIYWFKKNDRQRAIRYLKRLLRRRSQDVTLASKEEAQELLNLLEEKNASPQGKEQKGAYSRRPTSAAP